MKPHIFQTALLTILLSLCNCFVFSNFQSAKLLSPNQFEIEPVCSMTSKFINRTSHKNPMMIVGLQTGYGVSNDFNLRARYLFLSDFSNNNSHYFEIEPKFSIKKNTSSFSIPVGWYSEKTLQIMPSLIFSNQINKNITLNTSPRIPIAISVMDNYSVLNYIGFSVDEGVSFSLASGSIIITPEVGMNTFSFSDILFCGGISVSIIK